jgi:hypothetical protein
MRACFILRLKSLPKNASVYLIGEAGRRALLPGFLLELGSRSVVIDQTRSSFHHKPVMRPFASLPQRADHCY